MRDWDDGTRHDPGMVEGDGKTHLPRRSKALTPGVPPSGSPRPPRPRGKRSPTQDVGAAKHLPLTTQQEAVLRVLRATGRGPAAIGRAASLSTAQASNALLRLQARDLARRTDDGWRKA